MPWIAFKYLLTAAVVVAASEFAARNPRVGGLIAALPIVSVLTLVWLHLDRQPAARVADFSWYTFWYVLPTLPMLPVMAVLLPRLGFWTSLLAATCVALAGLALCALVLRRYGIELL